MTGYVFGSIIGYIVALAREIKKMQFNGYNLREITSRLYLYIRRAMELINRVINYDFQVLIFTAALNARYFEEHELQELAKLGTTTKSCIEIRMPTNLNVVDVLKGLAKYDKESATRLIKVYSSKEVVSHPLKVIREVYTELSKEFLKKMVS